MEENKKKKFYYFLSSGLGAGFLPKSPGTFGTISALLVYYLLLLIFNLDVKSDFYLLLGLISYSVIFGTFFSNEILKFEENKFNKDPQFIVIDEWAGFYITILFSTSWLHIIVGFLLFRLFDIWKPWLIGKAENFPRGYGIMADDIVAGFFALIIMNLIFINF